MDFHFASRPRRGLFVLLSLAGFACFFGGVLLGNLLHLAACPLCILQRMLFLLVGLIGLVGAGLAGKPLGARLTAALLTVTAGTGVYIAAYQSWLQQHPEGPSCTASSPWWENFVYWAGQQAPDFFLSSGMCSDPGFVLFGLTIANYSLIVFSLLTLASLVRLFSRP